MESLQQVEIAIKLTVFLGGLESLSTAKMDSVNQETLQLLLDRPKSIVLLIKAYLVLGNIVIMV